MIDTIIFDLNNVAENYDEFKIEIEHHIPEVLINACKLLDCPYDKNELEKLYKKRLLIINNVPFQHHPAFWQSLFEEYLKRNLSYKEISKIYDSYLSKYHEIINCYPDFIDAIDISIKNNYKIGVIANGNTKRIYKFLEKFNLIRKLNSIVTSGSTPFSKPNSAIFELSIFNLKSLPFNSIFVGDRLDTDIVGSNRVGMWSVHLRRGAAQNAVPKNIDFVPDFSIDSLNNLFEVPIFKNTSQISDIVIPCGGRGKRMGNLTINKQKCMLPDNRNPILYTISKIMAKCGVEKIHFLLGHGSEHIKRYFSSISKFHSDFVFHDTHKECTGQALYAILDILPDRFFYCHGNILFPPSLVFRLEKKFYMNNYKSTFVITDNNTAKTHPVFSFSKETIVDIQRYDRDIRDIEEAAFSYSMGFAVINKNDIFHGIKEFPGPDVTTEQLFLGSLKKVDTLMFNEEWYHLEREEDLLKYNSYYKLIESKLECLANN